MTQTPTQNQPIMRLYGKVMQFDMLDSGRSHSLYMKMYMYKGIPLSVRKFDDCTRLLKNFHVIRGNIYAQAKVIILQPKKKERLLSLKC